MTLIITPPAVLTEQSIVNVDQVNNRQRENV